MLWPSRHWGSVLLCLLFPFPGLVAPPYVGQRESNTSIDHYSTMLNLIKSCLSVTNCYSAIGWVSAQLECQRRWRFESNRERGAAGGWRATVPLK